jgi:hypothetical protein
MKKNRTSQLRHHVASTRRSSVSLFVGLRVRICFALICAATISVHADVITVTNTNDNGLGSLRQALADAMDGDTISFAVTGTITLTSGELLIDKNITISGPGAQSLVVDGNDNSPVFHTASGQTVTISGLTITNSRGLGFDGAVYTDDATTLTLSNCTISANSATAIYNQGAMQISYSTVSDNGAGISNDAHKSGSATMDLNYSSVTGNGFGIQSVACGHSGCASAFVAVENSTISGNSGGIYGDAFSGLMISNSTISSNDGGAVNSNQECVINNSTLEEDSGYDIYNNGYVVEIRDTVLKIGPSGHTIVSLFGQVKSNGYSLSSDDGGGYLNGPGDQINTDPMLGPLQDNGGPTFTHALLPGSPAIDAGDPNFNCAPCYDQRGPGFLRVVNGRVDIGSFEAQNGGTPTPTSTPTATPTPTARPTPTPRPQPSVRPRPTPVPRP